MTVAFTSYAFAATGVITGTTRTLPDRLSDVINVKDWGALGDGLTDDTSAIQAAITYAWSISSPSGRGSTVFFPRGTYIVNTGISLANPSAPFGGALTIIGAGRDATVVKGDYPGGYLMNSIPGAATDNVDLIQDMTIWNESQVADSGAFMIFYTEKSRIFNCGFKGIVGLAVDRTAGNFGVTIQNCVCTCSAATPVADSVGIYAQQGQVVNCKATGFDIGFSMSAIVPNITGCYASNCNTGILLGKARDPAGSVAQGSGCFSNRVDSCLVGIDCHNTKGLVAANVVSGALGPGGAAIQYGIVVSFAQDFVMLSNVTTATATVASISLGNGGSSIFINCFCASMRGPDGWSAPAGLFGAPGQWSFVNCGVAGASPPVAFLNFADTNYLQDRGGCNIIDANLQNSFGGVVTGGGSNHYKVYYDGTNWVRVG